MTEPWRKVAKQNRVDSQNVIAIRIVKVSLVCDVVEVWQVLWKIRFLLALLEHVLLLVPEPLRVDLAKVLYKQGVPSDALFSIAEDAKTFWMDSKVWVILAFCCLNSLKYDTS